MTALKPFGNAPKTTVEMINEREKACNSLETQLESTESKRIQENTMDGGHKSARKYPSYTLEQLEAFVAEGGSNPVMVQEIADCKAGTSKILVVPQIEGGKPNPKVGRL